MRDELVGSLSARSSRARYRRRGGERRRGDGVGGGKEEERVSEREWSRETRNAGGRGCASFGIHRERERERVREGERESENRDGDEESRGLLGNRGIESKERERGRQGRNRVADAVAEPR